MIDDQRQVAGEAVDLPRLRRFYAARGFAPLWLSGNGGGATLSSAAAATAQTFQAAADDGLEPQAYHADALSGLATAGGAGDVMAGGAGDATERRLALELLLTDGLLRYAHDVRAGRVTPQRISRDLDIDPPVVDAAAAAVGVATAADPAAALAALGSANPDYRGLRRLLGQLRQTGRAGGWPAVPAFRGKSRLVLGDSDPAVPALRDRLAASGEYAGPRNSKATAYDAPLKAAVARFQARHGLEADGVLNAATLAEINVPVAARIEQVLANLERARWLPDSFGPRHIRVNAADFRLTAVTEGQPSRSMRVVVGTKQRRTPVLASAISSVVLNPTWTMPPRLAKEDYLPKLLKNPGYLAEHGFTVYSGWGAGAQTVDVRKINWKNVGSGIGGLKLRQEPGPQNALGRIKFNIDNDFDVYLHDTPSRDKFARSMRALSSGCVRLGEPMALADFVFADVPEWGEPQRQATLDSLKTRFITLKQPIPVYILYQTVWVDDDGAAQFRPDVYERDGELNAAVARVAASAGQTTGPTRVALNGR